MIQLQKNRIWRDSERYYHVGEVVVTEHAGGRAEADALLAKCETVQSSAVNGILRKAAATVLVIDGGRCVYRATRQLITD
jgi:hypothetical protein